MHCSGVKIGSLSACCLLAMSLALLAGCQVESAPPTTANETGAPQNAQAVTAEMHAWPRMIRVQGSLRADEHAVIGAKVAGRVDELHVDIGSPVRRGETLMTLEMEDLDLSVQQADAALKQACARLGISSVADEQQLDPAKVPTVQQEFAMRNEARTKYERAKTLATMNAIVGEELQEREAALAVAEAHYQSALNAVSEGRALVQLRAAELARAIQAQKDAAATAPFDGVIEQRNVAPGVFVQVGQSIVTLVRTNPLRFRGSVPERDAIDIREKQKVNLLLRGQKQPIATTVKRISPALNPANRALSIEADIPNAEGILRAGLFCEAQVEVDADAQVVAVPASALFEFAGVEKVWLIVDGKLQQRPVETGRREGRWVEIISGLTAGEVIAENSHGLRPGPVTIQTPKVVTAATAQ